MGKPPDDLPDRHPGWQKLGPGGLREVRARHRQVFSRPSQPATGYQKNVTPRGPVVRPEDAFPESCCEGSPPAQDENETEERG